MSEQTPKDNLANEQLQPTPETISAKSQSKTVVEQESLIKKILKQLATQSKNVVCLVIWTWLLCRIIGKPFPFISSTELFNYVYYIYNITGVSIILQVALIITILGILFFKKHWKILQFFLFFLLRLVFFPVIFIFYVIYIPYKTASWLYKGINTFLGSLLRTTILKAVALLLLLLISSFIIIINAESLLWLIISLIMIMLAIVINLRVAFIWTSKPLIIMEQLLDTYFKVIDFYLKTTTGNIKPKEDLEANEKEFEKFKKQLDPIYESLNWSENFVERNTDQRITVKFFIVLLAACFSITVISFGLGYSNLNKIYPNSFTNADSWTWLDYIYSSLLVITTSGEIHPLWAGSKVAVSLEIISGICLLSLVVFQFSVLAIPEIVDKKAIILNGLKKKKESITRLEEITRRMLIGKSSDVIDVNPEDVKIKE